MQVPSGPGTKPASQTRQTLASSGSQVTQLGRVQGAEQRKVTGSRVKPALQTEHLGPKQDWQFDGHARQTFPMGMVE